MVIKKPSNSPDLSFSLLQRTIILDPNQFPLSISGGWEQREPEIIRAMFTSLEPSEFQPRIRPDEHVAQVLLEGLKAYAGKHHEIGSEVMVISHVPRLFQSFVSFEALREHYQPMIRNILGDDFKYLVSYSPWIIAPWTYYASTEFISEAPQAVFGFTTPDGNRKQYKINIKGLEQDPSLPKVFFMGQHPVGKAAP